MLINAISTFALYCQQCGKIQMHDISHFSIKKTVLEFKCSCGHVQARLARASTRQFILSIPCVACQSTHDILFNYKKLLQTKAEQVYCLKDNFELGYFGTRAAIDQILTEQKRECVSLMRETASDESDEYIEKQHIILGILNKIHDIAEQGGIYCRCGSESVEADLLPDCILVECMHCGAYYSIAAQTEYDLQYAQTLDSVELVAPRCFAKRIDFD